MHGNKIVQLLRTTYVGSVLLAILIFIVIVGVRKMGGLQTLELGAYDLLVNINSSAKGNESRFLIIRITEDDLQRQKWPMTDASLTELLEILIQYDPVAIGIDIYRDIPVPPGTEQLHSLLSSHSNIIAVMKFSNDVESRIKPPSILENTDQVGFNDIIVDADGIVRRALLFLDDGVDFWTSFALQLALRYLEAYEIAPEPDENNPAYLKLGASTLIPFEPNDGGYINADARGYQILANFEGAATPIPSISLTTALQGGMSPDMVSGKIILIGVMAVSVKDLFYIPIKQSTGSQQIHGVAVHGHLANQLIEMALTESRLMKSISDRYEYVWFFFWSLLGTLLAFSARTFKWLLALEISGLIILIITCQAMFLLGWWIPLVPAALGWFFSTAIVSSYIMTREKADRVMLMQMFSKHVSKDIAEHIWREREQFIEDGRIKPQELIATVLFTDIRGFTTISEKMDPASLINWLNVYMETVTNIVLNHDGVVDKYIGDAVMALFGVPLPRGSDEHIRMDAVNAVDAAWTMSEELKKLNEKWRRRNIGPVGMRVGIFTGPLVAGSLGSLERMDYTVIGDTVNIASRLESFDKNIDIVGGDCRILVGGSTLGYVADMFRSESIGEVKFKGKTKSVKIYQIIGRKSQSTKAGSSGI